jgi:hypothetical protein
MFFALSTEFVSIRGFSISCIQDIIDNNLVYKRIIMYGESMKNGDLQEY